ncbi:MAG: hypothetical protein ACAI35_11235 [Candidatus Methylacidiphilales bacterium]|nr:hypothetical protein [Candidatus Methylacidiphilales bacterium]
MKTAPIHSIIAASFLAVGLAFVVPAELRAAPVLPAEEKNQFPTLEQALRDAQVTDGWNSIATMPESGDILWAQTVRGQVIRWQVRTAEGKEMPTRIVLSENPSNLRIMWSHGNAPLQFIEAPAWVVQPETAPDF